MTQTALTPKARFQGSLECRFRVVNGGAHDQPRPSHAPKRYLVFRMVTRHGRLTRSILARLDDLERAQVLAINLGAAVLDDLTGEVWTERAGCFMQGRVR